MDRRCGRADGECDPIDRELRGQRSARGRIPRPHRADPSMTEPRRENRERDQDEPADDDRGRRRVGVEGDEDCTDGDEEQAEAADRGHLADQLSASSERQGRRDPAGKVGARDHVSADEAGRRGLLGSRVEPRNGREGVRVGWWHGHGFSSGGADDKEFGPNSSQHRNVGDGSGRTFVHAVDAQAGVVA